MPKVDITCATAQRLMLDILNNTINHVIAEIYQLEKREVVGSELSEEEYQRLVKLMEYRSAMTLVLEYFTRQD